MEFNQSIKKVCARYPRKGELYFLGSLKHILAHLKVNPKMTHSPFCKQAVEQVVSRLEGNMYIFGKHKITRSICQESVALLSKFF